MTENNDPASDGCGEQAAPPIDDDFRDGLALLSQAYMYARDASAALWDFALENDQLYAADVTISDLRWLVAKGLAEHGQETSFYGDPHARFAPASASTSSPRLVSSSRRTAPSSRAES